MDLNEFNRLLDLACGELDRVAKTKGFLDSGSFENTTRVVLAKHVPKGLEVDFDPHPQAFPDISLGRFGIECKFTRSDSWRTVANSISEGMRDKNVEHVFLLYCKAGGNPEVRYRRYEECVMHVRTSHVPRFEVDLFAEESLFARFGVSYGEFAAMPMHRKMQYVRDYARSRLSPGERLWWLADDPTDIHTLSLGVRLYTNLPQSEKRQLRAEAAVLCPSIAKPSRAKGKYNDAVLYLLTYRGVLVFQARDLFTAGSVALRSDSTRGGNYLLRSLRDIQSEIDTALSSLPDEVIREYWGRVIPIHDRKAAWLKMLDSHAVGWSPSSELFRS